LEFLTEYYGNDCEKKVLEIIRLNDSELFDIILKGEVFESKMGLRELINSISVDNYASVSNAMEESLHCRAYMKKESLMSLRD